MKKIIAIILFLIPTISFGATYGSDFLTGGSIGADGYEAWGTPAMAVDNNSATLWANSSAMPHWLKYDLGAGVSKTARKITIWYNDPPYEWNPKDWKLQGSNDDSNWTDIATSTYVNTHDLQSFTFENSNAYRYYKLNILSTWGTAQTWGEVSEWEAMECLTDCGGVVISTSTAWTEVCYTGTTSTSCYRPLDVYKSYAIDGLFILIPLFIGAWLIKRRKNMVVKL